MDSNDFLKKVKSVQKLPGVIAHQKIIPDGRPLLRAEVKDLENYRFASVGIVCWPNTNNEIEFLLIERPEYEGAHSGQMAFPGGKEEVEDVDLFATAIREIFEEVGISLLKGDQLLQMTEIIIPVSQFIVQPYLFYIDQLPVMTLDKREVKDVFSISLSELLHEDTLKTTTINLSNNIKLKNSLYFDLENKIVWGATALILSELKDILA